MALSSSCAAAETGLFSAFTLATTGSYRQQSTKMHTTLALPAHTLHAMVAKAKLMSQAPQKIQAAEARRI